MRPFRFVSTLALVLALVVLFPAALPSPAGAGRMTAEDGVWLVDGKPFFSTTAHAVFYRFLEDRDGAVEDLKAMKAAGFTIVEVYWRWNAVLDPQTDTFAFAAFDDFVLTCKEIGLATFCMFAEYVPQWLAAKHGWAHTSELGQEVFRSDDFYVCDPSYKSESRRFYAALLDHLKERSDVSDNILYWNMGGEYKPFMPIRQEREIDYGYDSHTVGAFRRWLERRGDTPRNVELRWGAPLNACRTWDDVWPAVGLKKTDYKDRDLKNWGQARWDWFSFRQEVAGEHMADAVSWIREAGDLRPMIHEYNTVIPGELPLFLDWSRVGAHDGRDGVFLATGTFDREFDFHGVLYNLCIARGASDPPWQSNEQGGQTSTEWMRRHAWFLIAMGGTGLHVWDWRSDEWGLLNADGTEKEGLAAATRLNAEFAFLGDLLAGSRPMPNRIGIVLLAEETLAAPRAHTREYNLLLKALLEHGNGPEVAVLTEDALLRRGVSGYSLLILPGQLRVRREVRDALARYVEQGGTLWLTPGCAEREENDKELLIQPGPPLDLVAGARAPFAGQVHAGSKRGDNGRWFGLQQKATMSVAAEPVAHAGDQPAVWRNGYCKGTCFLQTASFAALPAKDTPLERDRDALAFYLKSNAGQVPLLLLREILAASRCEPYAQVFARRGGQDPLASVSVGVRRADPGYLLLLIEGDNRAQELRVQLNAERLSLKGAWTAYEPFTLRRSPVSSSGAFETSLAPAETKVVHLVPTRQAAAWAARFREQEWDRRVAALPALPARLLVPPAMLGAAMSRMDGYPGPTAHGERWLLADLSAHANRSLADEGRMENAKAFLGSVGTGDNDLRELPVGIQEFDGVPFSILAPAQHAASCLITKTVGRPWLGPLDFRGIRIDSTVKRIHWLYGSGWAPFDLPVGYVTYRYADGSVEQENLICGDNIANWWGYGGPPKNPRCTLAWSGSTPAAKRNFTQVGLYHYVWDNPHPAKPLSSIDLGSYGGDACLILVSLTAER